MRPRHWSLDQISPFEKQRVVDPKPYEPFLKESLENAGNAFPVFKNAGIAESWGGMLDVTPDALPVICSIDERPGLFVASGFSGHGFGLGPAAGKLAADMVCGNTPSVDPNPFHIKRFNAAIYPKPSPLAM
jgi:glycine/D-amino acid oxidase-like deaminating enzyme